RIRFSERRDVLEIEMQGAPGNVANLLAILSDGVRSMYVPPGSLAEVRRRDLPAFAKDQELPDAQAKRAVARALYGEHPYGRFASPAQLEAIGGDAIASWLKQVYRPQNATLTVVGDVNPEEVEALAREWLGSWVPAPNGQPLPAPAPAKPAEGNRDRILVISRPGAPQAKLELNCLLPPADEARWPL